MSGSSDVDGRSTRRSAKTEWWVAWAAVYAAWMIAQPLIDGLLELPAWLALVIRWLGLLAIVGGFLAAARHRTKLFREALSAARIAHPDSVVYGIRLDPITTPVGVEWADSRAITWGLLRANAYGIDISRSDGSVMLHRPWGDVDLLWSPKAAINVDADGRIEEWWVPLVSDWGFEIRGQDRPVVRRRIQAMLALRDAVATERPHR